MKVLCDVGNTFTTMLFINDKDVKIKKFFTRQFLKIIKKYINEDIYISCVVGEIEKHIVKNVNKNIKFIKPTDLKKYIKIDYDELNLGSDRALNAFFVKEIFGKNSCVVSLGTAIVIDYIDKRCRYIGGEIFPGIKILSDGLYNHTSKLPYVKICKDLKNPNNHSNLIGKNTKDCIEKGILNFCFSGIKNFIEILKPKNLIFTGGDAEIFFEMFSFRKNVDNIVLIKNLVILGIILWCYYEGYISQEEFENGINKIF